MPILSSNRLNTFPQSNPVSFVMIVIISIVFILQNFLIVFGINLGQLGAIRTFDQIGPNTVALNTEYYRLITAIFLHGSFLHYLFNTFFGFYIIGASLERLIGSKKYLIALIVSGLGSSLIVYGWEYYSFVYLESFRIVSTLGASGAIFGTMGFLFYLTMVRSDWFSPQDISSIRGIILLNVVFSFFGNISTAGHLGGLFSGFIIALLLTGKTPYYKKSKGFENPHDPYNYEDWDIEDLDEVVFVDDEDDDDDDRRVW
ncbi:rhomboid family intramembrane serine protease [Liberiplasma polymorphum]|uniref:rhomboid family intramembrane serine protease n=1 Tax=Liberiplasma polymorphum TaxID=3374570 RepID=UPI003773E9B7